MYLGDFLAGATIDFKWNTMLNGTGSITRATDGTIKVYKNNSTTERSSASGITDTEDFDSRTGVHHCRIDLSDNADAGFYAAGNDYQVLITGMVISGMTINAVIAEFSIENRNIKVNVTQWSGTAVAAPHTNGYPVVTIKDGTGTGEIDTTSGGVLVAAIANNAITAASIATGAIDADAIADNAIDAGAFAADALTAAKFASDVGTEIATAVWAAGTRTLSALDEDSTTLDLDATIRAAVGMSSANLDTQLAKLDTIDDFLDTEIAAIKAKTDQLAFTTANQVDARVMSMANNTMTAAASAADFLAEINAEADTAIADAALATAANLSTVAGYVDTEIAAIIALIGTPAGASVSADIAAIKSETAAILTDTGTTLDGKIDVIDGIVDAIKLKTDLIPGDMDGLSLAEMLTLMGASLLGKLSGAATTTVVIRAADDSKDRITATVDADGNRTAVVLDAA